MKEYLKSWQEIAWEVRSGEAGLSNEEAKARIEKNGLNRLLEAKKPSLLKRFLAQLADPMIIVLIVAALLSVITAVYSGDSFADAIIIMAVVLMNAVMGVIQESKAEQAIAALSKMTAPTSKVMRDGHMRVIPSEELVVGDVILMEAGDSVPADARLMECASLKMEESALTGESVPVNKDAEAIAAGEKDVPLGDRKNMAYMGSSVVYGRGRAIVTATGMQTEVGKIAGALAQAKEGETPLQKKLSQLSKILSALVLGLCAVMFAFSTIRSYPNITVTGLLDTFMVAISLAVAAIPEGLAAVVTIVLSIGVTNMSRKNAIVRKLTAVETLGCAQVICSDKTGTLTQNRMTVVESVGTDKSKLATAMTLCSDAEIDENGNAVGEPTECALVNFAHQMGMDKDKLNCPRVGEAPFDSMRKMMSTVHRTPDGSIVQYTKGAPDEVLKHCTRVWIDGNAVEMTEALRKEILSENKRMADKALRVLAAAEREWDGVPTDCSAENLEKELTFIGMTGMIDPVRPEAKAAIAECRRAGIRPIMITGDHKDTATAIALELGILTSADQAITGSALDDMTDEELQKRIDSYSVYARVQPEHKVRIVNAWRARGKVTAMTGDGVNDAPSIKNADIGIGMGITGTDVTKNVADMVLADDNFATIVVAVSEGRRIYANIRKAIQFLLSSNLAEVIAVFVSTLVGFTVLKPAHLLWVNLITDSIPALALGVEPAENDSMDRPPRDSSEGIFSGGVGVHVVIQGFVIAAITLLSYLIGHRVESGAWALVDSPDGMTMAFLTLSLTEMFHAFNMRSLNHSIFTLNHRNKLMYLALALSIVLTTAVIYVPFLADAFGFTAVSFAEYLIAAALAFTVIPLVETAKWFVRKSKRK